MLCFCKDKWPECPEAASLQRFRSFPYDFSHFHFSSGWWFQTWLLLSISYMGCHPFHWRTHIFLKMVKTTNQWGLDMGIVMGFNFIHDIALFNGISWEYHRIFWDLILCHIVTYSYLFHRYTLQKLIKKTCGWKKWKLWLNRLHGPAQQLLMVVEQWYNQQW
jgi:hypothetical protein